MSILKTIYFVCMLVSMTLYHALCIFILDLRSRLLRQPFPTEKGHETGIKWGRRVMALTPGWKVKFSGRKNIPHGQQSFIIVANHESTTDIFSIFLLGIQFRWLAKHELFKVPILGYCMRKIGYVAVKRGDKHAHKEALEECTAWIQRGIPVLFFPEGTRSLDGSPKKFKMGAFKLAVETHKPLLPVVLSGAGKLLKKGSLTPSPAVLKIKVLPLVYKREGESIEDLTQRVQSLVVEEHRKLLSSPLSRA